MSVSYEGALDTLQAMFGEQGWSRDDLGRLLRIQQGHMEQSCEVILMSEGVSAKEVLAGLSSNDTSNDARLAREMARENGRPAVPSRPTPAPAPTPLPTPPQPKGRGTPTTLPRDFLRIPGHATPTTNATSSPAPGNSQMISDEQLARMLQDELFVSELANNPEFAHIATNQRGGRMPMSIREAQMMGQHQQQNARAGGGEGSGSGNGASESRGIGEQIGSMTDEAKRRMGLFAKNFTNRKKKNQTGSDAEARGLLSGEVEEEITFSPLGERSSGEGGMEMGTFMNDAHNKKDK